MSDFDVFYIEENEEEEEFGDIGTRCLCRCPFDKPITTDHITITITGAVPGSKYEDTCISEISVY